MQENKIVHILFASRLVKEKGVDILIDAIRATLSDRVLGTKIIWHICSHGEYQREILNLTIKYPGKVIYHGSVSQIGLATLYHEADLLFMPSRFLETFGLTALEALACGTPVIGFAKGGLISFITKDYLLHPEDPVGALIDIVQKESETRREVLDVSEYRQELWKQRLRSLIGSQDRGILLLHDYKEKIGGAEHYVSQLEEALMGLSYDTSRFGYEGKTTVWKRRWMFMLSLFTFYRGLRLSYLLSEKKPKIIWMHSVQRYIGYWGLRAVMNYSKKYDVKVYLSHHDIGLMVPFPQDITEESQIPRDPSLSSFIRFLSPLKKIIASAKWYYVALLRKQLPENTEHIIFAPFLESHIHQHFPDQNIRIFPHSYDESIFHP